ncbi:MAG: L-threonylcarbamoyladenylate synthase [Planctomycetota bacterium]
MIQLDSREAREQALRVGAEVVNRGGIVLFPTETVYGLGCDAGNPEALRRLQALKAQDASKPFQHLVPSVDAASRLVGAVSRSASKLMRCYWPGPLTLVLPAEGGGTVGVRLPDHRFIQALLRESGLTLAATSANLHGQSPVADGREGLAVFDGLVDLILDEGPAAMGKASSVVGVDEQGLRVFREEAVPESELREVIRPTVLILEEEGECFGALSACILEHLLFESVGDFRVQYYPGSSGRWVAERHAMLAVLERLGYPKRESGAVVPVDAPRWDEGDLLLLFSQGTLRQTLTVAPDVESRSLLVEHQKGPAHGAGADQVSGGYMESAIWLESELWKVKERVIECLT